MKLTNSLNFSNYQALNMTLQNLATDPGSPTVGQVWFNTAAGSDTQGRVKVKLGTRTITLDDQYVTGVGVTAPIGNSGTALAPVINIAAASGSTAGSMSIAHFNLVAGATNVNTGSTVVARDASGNFAASTITATAIQGLNDPVNPQDACNLRTAQSFAAGFDPKASVRVATLVALPANTYSNGTSGVGATLTGTGVLALGSIDSTTLVVGDRLLVKNEATPANNGIYTVTNLGNGTSQAYILTRALDFNTSSQISPGAFMFVEVGSQATTQWVMSTANPINVGSTSLNFVQFGAGSAYTAGSGLTGTSTFSVVTSGSTIEINTNALRVKSNANTGQPLLSAGTGVEASYGAINLAGGSTIVTGLLPVGNGGTGANTAAGARTALSATGKFASTVGDGSTTAINVVHNLNTTDVTVSVIEISTKSALAADWAYLDANTITVSFGVAPALNTIRVVVIG